MGFNDRFEQVRRSLKVDELKRVAAIVPIDVGEAYLDTDIFESWAESYRETGAPHSYYDYYFAGQDIKVYIVGAEDFDIPIIEMGFNIEQQKAPVYGLWSYTYDAVLRGTRLVSGTFSIATTSTDFMRRALSKSASERAASSAFTYMKSKRTEDDVNIDKYWGRNLDPNLGPAQKNIFSVHPPFDFIVKYGIQTTSIDQSGNDTHWDPNFAGDYGEDYPLSMDTNERLVNTSMGQRVLQLNIEACEIQSMQVGYAPDGSVITETYQFFARDIIIPTSK